MPSPRTRRRAFAVPREITNAPLEAHRSHLYPVAPPTAAYERMARGDYAYEQWLPQSFGQNQWLKDSDYGYPPQMANVEAFARVVRESGGTLRTIRQHAPQHPQLPWVVVAQQLVDQADWGLPTDPPGRRPLARGVPEPRPLPFETFESQHGAPWPEPAWLAYRQRNRNRAMRRIRELESEWAPFTWG